MTALHYKFSEATQKLCENQTRPRRSLLRWTTKTFMMFVVISEFDSHNPHPLPLKE